MRITSLSDNDLKSVRASQLNKCYYQADQQAKFLHLQAEVDSLLQELQTLRMQRLSTTHKERWLEVSDSSD